ncbi:hypothetical protein BC936DRAFT_148190 [Jimgerdemannia flammicorona]|uniref:Uncharacterized protein n=1 Tax=Jimgerdemannia flammicorona TaxID=994334 RepID=A0A433D3N6_9FUNG|nr:hypothetical protein BC936DRAFT_148190 [Jimgerdemannia flammicorona]
MEQSFLVISSDVVYVGSGFTTMPRLKWLQLAKESRMSAVVSSTVPRRRGVVGGVVAVGEEAKRVGSTVVDGAVGNVRAIDGAEYIGGGVVHSAEAVGSGVVHGVEVVSSGVVHSAKAVRTAVVNTALVVGAGVVLVPTKPPNMSVVVNSRD